jgi:RNA 3'-terminal phosphate cyclase (ATP)
MIEIDGSYGEGGGQIVRTAVALSAVTGEDVKVTNIRKNRPEPGLKAQHLTAIRTAALICDANVTGLSLHSTDISFSPGEIRGGKHEIDIGTAGSISLLLQCLMPAAVHAGDELELTITGGTDVAWSPSIDYLRHVTNSALSRMGYDCEIVTLARGYYPKGGGCVRARIGPSELKGYDFTVEKCQISGISHCSNLPEHVAKRQADSAAELVNAAGFGCHIDTECAQQFSTGSGITLWSGLLGGSALGKRGLPAEKVGRSAAEELLTELRAGASVDVHLADQLIPYMGLSGGGSYTVRELSQHTRTNIWATEQFLDVFFNIQKRGKLVEVSVGQAV